MRCSAENIEKYDGNLWTLIWLHLAVFPSNKHLSISTSILWQQQKKLSTRKLPDRDIFMGVEVYIECEDSKSVFASRECCSSKKTLSFTKKCFHCFLTQSLCSEISKKKACEGISLNENIFSEKSCVRQGGFRKSSYKI